jgi:hypothetical protein
MKKKVASIVFVLAFVFGLAVPVMANNATDVYMPGGVILHCVLRESTITGEEHTGWPGYDAPLRFSFGAEGHNLVTGRGYEWDENAEAYVGAYVGTTTITSRVFYVDAP